jgi:TetR/AcrR family transcriptional regulator, cholesterol catabolism regulator
LSNGALGAATGGAGATTLNVQGIRMARTPEMRKPISAHEMLKRIKSTVDDPELVERRRAQITKATITTLIRLGYHACTVRDVAKEAEVSVGLIYQYVEDKEDLLLLALVDILHAYRRNLPTVLEAVADPLERFVKLIQGYCAVHGLSPDATVLAYQETASLSKKRRDLIKHLEVETNQLIIEAIRDCIKAGVFEADIQVDVFCYQIVMFSHTWGLKAWYFKRRMSLETYVEHGLKLILRGVMTAKGARRLRVLQGRGT